MTPPRAPMTHVLKTWTEWFEAVWDWRKTFEVRLGDRDYREGDMLCLQEWDEHMEEYTGRVTWRRVGYVLEVDRLQGKGAAATGLVVLSLKDMPERWSPPEALDAIADGTRRGDGLS